MFDHAKTTLATRIDQLDKGTVPKDANWGMEAVVAGSMYKGINVEKRVETLYNLSVQKGQLTSAQQKELGDIYDLTGSNFIVHASTMGSMSMEKAEFQKGLERTAEGQTYLGYALINVAVGKMAQYNLDAGVGISNYDDPANSRFKIESKGGVAARNAAEVRMAGSITVAPAASPVVSAEDSPSQSLVASVNTTGKLTGSIEELTAAEKKVANDLIITGKNVEAIPKDPNSVLKTPDFSINGVKTELKSLQNPNTNTGMKRIQDAFKQGAETVIIDAREAGLSSSQAKEIICRAAGKYPNNQLPGKVEIWINGEIITYSR